MASQVSPGIVLKERDLSNAVIVGASQITAAHASTFQKGPIGTVVDIASQKELISVFGAPTEGNAEDWFVASEFLNYGGRLAVTRASTGVTNANGTAAANVLVKNSDDWNEGSGNNNQFVARTAGSWGNGLMVVVVDRGADQNVTFSNSPAAIAAGTTLTFTGGQQAVVHTVKTNATTGVVEGAAVILNKNANGGFTRLTTSDTLDTPDTGAVATFGITANGAGYTDGQLLTTTSNGAGINTTVTVAVTVGDVTAGNLANPGTGYNNAGGVMQTTGGGGVGLALTTTVNSGVIQTAVISDPGNGQYQAGDTVTVVGGNSNATFTITAVEGPANAIVLTTAGTGHSVGDVIVAVVGGLSFTVDSVVDTAIVLTAVNDWYTNETIGDTGLTLGAIGPRPGTSAFASGLNLSYDEVHFAVIDTTGAYSGSANTVLERMLYASKLSDGKSTEGAAVFYRDVINNQSDFFFNGTVVAGVSNPSTAGAGEDWDQASGALSANDLLQISGKIETTLGGGTDDYAYTTSEISDAFDEFADTETVNVDFVLMGGALSTETDTKAKAAKVIGIASGRKDAVAFVSPHKGNQVGTAGTLSNVKQKENTLAFFEGLTSTSYAVFDSGYKYYYDRFNDKYRYIPCNGDIAGLCVSTSLQLDDWYSPAGVNRGSLRNAIKLAYNPSKADRDELYQSRINPVVVFPGSGVTLFGDKTALASPSAFDRINVRRLFLNLEERVGGLAKTVLFEQNDATTRASFSSAVNSYLSEVQARRGVTDFLVVCDDTNNTPDVIDRNEFVAELFVKPTRSINYITVTFTATKTGVSFSEVVGR